MIRLEEIWYFGKVVATEGGSAVFGTTRRLDCIRNHSYATATTFNSGDLNFSGDHSPIFL